MRNLSKHLNAILDELSVSEVDYRGSKIVCTCPFAKWTHNGGSDSDPSFAFFIGGNSISYSCFACGAKGKIEHMKWRFMRRGIYLKSINALEWSRFEEDDESEILDTRYVFGGAGLFPKARIKYQDRDLKVQSKFHGKKKARVRAPYVPPTEEELRVFQEAGIPDYVRRKGYSKSHFDFGCGFDSRRLRWVIPVRNMDGSLAGFTSRTVWNKSFCANCGKSLLTEKGEIMPIDLIEGKWVQVYSLTTGKSQVKDMVQGVEFDSVWKVRVGGQWYSDQESRFVRLKMHTRCRSCRSPVTYEKYRHTTGMPKDRIVFALDRFVDGYPVLTTEGPTDNFSARQAGVVNAFGFLGTPTDHQFEKLASRIKASESTPRVIYGGFDADMAGENFHAMMVEWFRLHEPEFVVARVDLGGKNDLGDMDADLMRRCLPSCLFLEG